MRFLLSLGQMAILTGQTEANYERLCALTREAARRGSALVLFPELWYSGYDLDNGRHYAARRGEGIFARLSQLAQECHLAVGGSLLEETNEGIANTLVLFDANGECCAAYRKTHLFPWLAETRHLTPGERLESVAAPWGITGLALCYDLRFPEVFRHYALKGARLVLLAAQWPASRRHHWQTLVKARAIENQFFVAACNGVGNGPAGPLGGASAIITPWGDTLVEGDDSENLLTAEIDDSLIEVARRCLPTLSQRRPEIY